MITALQHQTRTGEPLLYEGSRSALIRNLSVFISHLENTLRPDSANYSLFRRASQVFSTILDEILEPQAPVRAPHIVEGPLLYDQMINLEDLDIFSTMDTGVAFDQWLF